MPCWTKGPFLREIALKEYYVGKSETSGMGSLLSEKVRASLTETAVEGRGQRVILESFTSLEVKPR